MRRRQSKILAEERRRAILQLVKKQGRAAVEDLVKQFNVSAATLRADLGQLAKEGNTRTHAEKTQIAEAASGSMD